MNRRISTGFSPNFSLAFDSVSVFVWTTSSAFSLANLSIWIFCSSKLRLRISQLKDLMKIKIFRRIENLFFTFLRSTNRFFQHREEFWDRRVVFRVVEFLLDWKSAENVFSSRKISLRTFFRLDEFFARFLIEVGRFENQIAEQNRSNEKFFQKFLREIRWNFLVVQKKVFRYFLWRRESLVSVSCSWREFSRSTGRRFASNFRSFDPTKLNFLTAIRRTNWKYFQRFKIRSEHKTQRTTTIFHGEIRPAGKSTEKNVGKFSWKTEFWLDRLNFCLISREFCATRRFNHFLQFSIRKESLQLHDSQFNALLFTNSRKGFE